MGATNFTTTAQGKTATAAYNLARLATSWEHEESEGYCGTISSTDHCYELNEHLFKGLRRETRIAVLELIALGSYDGCANKLSGKAKVAYNTLKHLPEATKWQRCYAVRLDSKTFAFSGIAAS